MAVGEGNLCLADLIRAPNSPTHASILLEVRDKTVLLEVGDKECHSHQ
jgi:hypothetical protein